jgi:hypothetical protein
VTPLSPVSRVSRSHRQAGATGRAGPPTDPGARRPRFDREAILQRIRDWERIHGEPPTTRDWDPSRARSTGQAWRAERFEAGDWPSIGQIRRQFGSFNAAVRAAGLSARRAPGRVKPHLTGSEQVTAAILAWTKRYGEPPTQADWDPVRARRLDQRWRIVRYNAGDWPSLNTVLYHFGTLGEAIAAAGLRPRRAGESARSAAQRGAGNLRAIAEREAGALGGAPGLAQHVEAVARARRATDPQELRVALLDVAAAALRWANELPWGTD